MEYTIRVGGEAGQGLLSIGNALAKILSRYGCHVFTHQDYMSRIRGGHKDRKSTRLNSSHQIISYAVFCLDRKSVV